MALVSNVGAILWCWALNLWELTLPPRRWYQKWTAGHQMELENWSAWDKPQCLVSRVLWVKCREKQFSISISKTGCSTLRWVGVEVLTDICWKTLRFFLENFCEMWRCMDPKPLRSRQKYFLRRFGPKDSNSRGWSVLFPQGKKKGGGS